MDIQIISDKASTPRGINLLLNEEKLKETAKTARHLFNRIQDQLKELDIKDGLSFLDLKNDLLLSYMIDICNIALVKLRGGQIEGHPSVDRSVESRVILEKIKGIELKLAYQLNQLITKDEQDEERVDLKNLDLDINDGDDDGDDEEEDEDNGDDEDDDEDDEDVDDDSDDDDADDEEDEDDDDVDDDDVEEPVIKKGAQGVYKPPKLRSVAYTGDVDKTNRGRRRNYDEFYQEDNVGEIVEESRSRDKSEMERIEFEENNYTRLPDDNPKKAKRKLKTKEYRRKGGNRKRFRRH